MVAQCTETGLQTVINLCKNKELFRIKIERSNDMLIMDYETKNDCDEESRNAISEILNNNTSLIITVTNELSKIKDILSIKELPSSYKMIFDCHNCRAGRPEYAISSSIPNAILSKIEQIREGNEEVVIDWEKVFKDKMDNKVPGLFSKKAAKKYMPVTYRELANILSEN